MRDIVTTPNGGAIVRAPEAPQANMHAGCETGSQLREAGKASLTGPEMKLRQAPVPVNQRRYEAVGKALHGVLGWVLAGIKPASAQERYLAQATDLADLERRQQALLRLDGRRVH